MAKKFRLVKEKVSSEENFTHPIHEQKVQSSDFDNHRILVFRPRRRNTGVWAIVGIVIVSLVVIAAIWMNGVNSSLSHLNDSVNQNAAAISKQQTQMAAMQAQLNAIMVQLAQIQANLVTFFTNVLQAIHRG